MNKEYPEIVLVSNLHDYSTDYIAKILYDHEEKFVRINRDTLFSYDVIFDIGCECIILKNSSSEIILSPEHTKSFYYRAPTFLREGKKYKSNSEHLFHTQWAAFFRSLSFFDTSKWTNNVVATYKAEMKPIQLKQAKKCGFTVPRTIITNTSGKNFFSKDELLALKTIDTAVLSEGNKTGFIYTNFLPQQDLEKYETASTPFFLQQKIYPKLDIRITVIGDKAYAFKILHKGRGIDGDWRKIKQELEYEYIDIPTEISNKCILLTKQLGLNFSGIDIIKSEDNYFFIELNPTGEWSWLMKNTGVRLDYEIAKFISTI